MPWIDPEVSLDTTNPIAFGMDADSPVWFEQSPAFELGRVGKPIAKYDGAPLMSGWLLGGEKLNGKVALADVPIGKGRAVLFGFRPQYRGQSYNTFKLLFNALLLSYSHVQWFSRTVKTNLDSYAPPSARPTGAGQYKQWAGVIDSMVEVYFD